MSLMACRPTGAPASAPPEPVVGDHPKLGSGSTQAESLPRPTLVRLLREAEREHLHPPGTVYSLHSDHGRDFADQLADSCQPTSPTSIECRYDGCGGSCFSEEIYIELRRGGAGWTVTRFDPEWDDRHHGCGICEFEYQGESCSRGDVPAAGAATTPMAPSADPRGPGLLRAADGKERW